MYIYLMLFPQCVGILASVIRAPFLFGIHQSTLGLNETPSCHFLKQETAGILGPYICPLELPWGPGQLVPRLAGSFP